MSFFDLSGKNAVVVGSGGLGGAIIKGLLDAGANVMMSDLKEETLKAQQQKFKDECGKDVSYSVTDATNEEQVAALVEKAAKQFGKVDILVNALGFNKKQPADEFDMTTFRQMMEVNVVSIMVAMKHFGAHMKTNGYGKIVNLSSVRGIIATRDPGNAAYCATKGAVDMLTKAVAAEYGPFGITVNAIGPAVTETPMMTSIIEMRGGDAYRKSLSDGLPMRRMPMPEDIVGTAVFLCSPASDFMTGHTLYPDGGQTAIG